MNVQDEAGWQSLSSSPPSAYDFWVEEAVECQSADQEEGALCLGQLRTPHLNELGPLLLQLQLS